MAGELYPVVSRRTMDCERGPLCRKLDGRNAGGKCGGSLKKCRVEIERGNFPRGLPSPVIRAYRTDEVNRMSQPPGMGPEVERRAAEANRVRKDIPQDFTDRRDGFQGVHR